MFDVYKSKFRGSRLKQNLFILLVVAMAFFFCEGGCGSSGDGSDGNTAAKEDYKDITKHNYIDLNDIDKISKFRSSVGHDYSDDFEDCRTMKHYFSSPIHNSTKIYSPINGTIIRIFAEKDNYPRRKDCQIWIEHNKFTSIEYRIFHVYKDPNINEGDKVNAGDSLGTFTDNEEGTSNSDIAIAHFTQEGEKLISYFNTLSEDVFQEFKDRGVESRDDLIISKEQRKEYPLECDGDYYVGEDPLDQYFMLNATR